MNLWFEAALLPEGWAQGVRIEVAQGKIAQVERNAAPHSGEERHGIALPGLCNVHSHAFQRAMAGLTEYRGGSEDDFWTWRALMYRFLAHLSPGDVEAIAAQAYAEMLESGMTRVGEFHYLHHDPEGRAYANPAEMAERIVAAAGETGIGLTLLPVFYAHGGFGGAPPNSGQRRFLTNPEQFAVLLEKCRVLVAPLGDSRVGVAPHSLRAVSPEELFMLVALAGSDPIHIHAAEQMKEVEDCLDVLGARPVEWLLGELALDSRWSLIHATHMVPSEITALAASGATAGLCPVTEANLGDGVFPAADYLGAAGAIGIGTDSNILIDAAQELRAIEYAQRLTVRKRNVLAGANGRSTGAALFEAALAGGARSLGLVHAGLVPGASADIVSLNKAHPSLYARQGDLLLDGWIFAAGQGAVESVWRQGRKVVEAGRHVRAEPIAARYRKTLQSLLAR